MTAAARPFGVYVHYPYCLSKCPYCDFASRAEAVIPQRRYTDAILRELRAQAPRFRDPSRPRRAVSLYFGGGTPSLWEPAMFAEVVREARALFEIPQGAEITIEANPGTADESRFAAFREAGANRISIGVQSFAPRQLVSLGRKHSGGDAERAYRTARAAGFTNVSLDLIHGAEEQTAPLAAADARRAIDLAPEHLSCYALTLTGLAEEVPMAKALRRGDLTLPDDESQAAMGEAVRDELERGGYLRYEISNFARPGREAVHNSLYWRGLEYAAVGCGACGFVLTDATPGPGAAEPPAEMMNHSVNITTPNISRKRQPFDPLRAARTVGRRWQNDRSPERYMERVEQTGLGEASGETLTAEEHLRERLFTGLRLAEGLDLAALERELGLPVRETFHAQIGRLVSEGLAESRGSQLALTARGLDLHSEAALRFF